MAKEDVTYINAHGTSTNYNDKVWCAPPARGPFEKEEGGIDCIPCNFDD